jgi:hypothetical protein
MLRYQILLILFFILSACTHDNEAIKRNKDPENVYVDTNLGPISNYKQELKIKFEHDLINVEKNRNPDEHNNLNNSAAYKKDIDLKAWDNKQRLSPHRKFMLELKSQMDKSKPREHLNLENDISKKIMSKEIMLKN